MMDKVRIGKILTTHGVKGEVKIYPLTDNIKRYSKLDWVYLENKHGDFSKVDIRSVRYHKEFVLVAFKDMDSINDVEQLKNYYLCIDKADRMPLPKGHYYIDDLIGLKVYEASEYLGTITEVLQPGCNDVYVLNSDTYKDLCIPALKSVILDVNIDEGFMKVKLPKGLID